jgi:hypothetical protein
MVKIVSVYTTQDASFVTTIRFGEDFGWRDVININGGNEGI